MISWLTEKLRYQQVSPTRLRSKLSEQMEVFWQAERKFELLFRKDFGVYLWAHYRVRNHYIISDLFETYDRRGARRSRPSIIANSRPVVGKRAQLR